MMQESEPVAMAGEPFDDYCETCLCSWFYVDDDCACECHESEDFAAPPRERGARARRHKHEFFARPPLFTSSLTCMKAFYTFQTWQTAVSDN